MRKERHSGVDDNGLLARLDSKQEKRLDRSIRYEYDEFDRVAKIDYGRGEIETFRYDSWGKLVEKTQSGRKAEFWYDYFGRLAEKHEEGLSTFYRYDAWGNRTARVTRTSTGLELAEERTYDRYGRLTEIRSDGKSVKYEYDRENRLARQIIDNIPVDFEYTKYNQLAAKYFGGKLQPVSTLRYFYAPDGTIVAREVGGELQRYTYDKRGQLLAVLDAQNRPVEQYTYDKAGNILEKFTNGVRTTFTYDKANQLVSSVDSKGNSKKYAYDAAGRLVKEGDRVYQYGWLDKVTQITEGDKVIRSFRYHMDGQLAAAYDDSSTETFLWDGLALIRRDTTNYLNEPAVTGGNPVIAGEKTLFNDLLGSTLGAKNADVFSAIERDAFGEVKPGETADPGINFFTGKPLVGELGYTFLFRNYRPEQGKWQTSDPLGYPDGWNNFSYCNNFPTAMIDLLGLEKTKEQQLTENLFKCATSDLPWAKNAQALLNAAAMNNPNPLKDYLNTTASTIGDLVDVLPDGTPGKSALEKVRDVAEAGGSIVSAVENFINNDPSFISDIISLSGAENIPGVGDYMGFINDSVSAISEALGDLKDSLAYGYGQYITDPTTGDFYLNSLIERELIVPKSLYEKALSRILE